MNNTALIAGVAFSAIFLGMFAFDNAEAAVFAKYDGIDGEAINETAERGDQDGWINLLSFDWGVSQPEAGASGQSRRRGSAVVEDVTLTMEFDKASPKIIEATLRGEVIPKVDVYLTKPVPCVPGSSDDIPGDGELCEVVYLRYELKNVIISSYQTKAADPSEVPEATTSNNFEEITIVYTEYDSEGNKGGNVETTWKVEKGEK